MKTLLRSEDNYQVWRHKGLTTFTGCQCIKDCTCNEDFRPAPYNYFTVKRVGKVMKTTIHNSWQEVEDRIKLLNSIINAK